MGLSGINYIVDERGKRTAVVIELNGNEGLWEELEALLLYHQRKDEPLIPMDKVHGKLNRRSAVGKRKKQL